MSHGGKRPGAGRKKGSLSSKTREIAREAFEQGITPLQVMLKAMTVHFKAKRYDQAAAIAKDAAPYVHPRLSAMQVSGDPGNPMQVNVTVQDNAVAAAAIRGMIERGELRSVRTVQLLGESSGTGDTRLNGEVAASQTPPCDKRVVDGCVADAE